MLMINQITNEKVLRNLAKIGRIALDVSVKLPSNDQVLNAKEHLLVTLPGRGRINFSYARQVLIGLYLSERYLHKTTGSLLLDDIKNEKRIYLNRYRRIYLNDIMR